MSDHDCDHLKYQDFGSRAASRWPRGPQEPALLARPRVAIVLAAVAGIPAGGLW